MRLGITHNNFLSYLGIGILVSCLYHETYSHVQKDPDASTAASTTPINKDSKTLRHVVLLSLEITSDDLKRIESSFAGLKANSEIVDFEWGTNNSPEG